MSIVEPTTPVFEVDRFGVDGDRLEIEGHWSGVRGLRFVRPTLTLRDGDHRRRLLASLDDKPWSPDSSTWVASFPWDGGDLEAEAAELAVGPSLVVDLPPPGGTGRRRPRREEGRFAATSSEPRDALTASRDAAASERDVLRRELAEITAERDDLRRERDAARHALASAETDRDDARRRLAGVEAQRDEARERVRKLEAQRPDAAKLKEARDAAVERAALLEAQLAARPVAPAPAPLPLSMRAQRETPSVGDSWLIRVTAALAVIVVLIVALLIFT